MSDPIIARAEADVFNEFGQHRHRLREAGINLDYYEGRTEAHRYRIDVLASDGLCERESHFMRRAIDLLSGNLYRSQPGRTVVGYEPATRFLNEVYKSNGMFAQWPRADALSLVNGVAAFQAVGTTDPQCPVRIHLWDASQFAVYTGDDDPCTPLAVVTIDCVSDGRKRYRLWTSEQVITYLSPTQGEYGQAAGSMPQRVSVEPNPYGVLPFSFVHYQFPSQGFWTNGPGHKLRRINQHLDFRLTELADNIRFVGKPIGVAEGTTSEAVPKKRPLPGEFIRIPPSMIDATDTGVKPSLHYLEADLNFVSADWEDLQNYRVMAMEEYGIPPSVMRQIQNVARSGESVKTEQLPLVLWSISRRQAFGHYEENLARLALTVAAAHLENNRINAAQLRAALADFELSLRWPDAFDFGTPGPDRDNADDWALRHNLTDEIAILMKRLNITEQEAVAHLEDTFRRMALVQAMRSKYGVQVAPVAPVTPEPPTDGPTEEATSVGADEGDGSDTEDTTDSEDTNTEV